MPAIEVIGPFRGPTGYDRHTRAFVRQLVRLGCAVQLTPFDYWSPPLPAGAGDPWYESLNRPVNAKIALHFTMPNQCTPRAGMRNVNYTMFEADRIPADWAARSREHDLIVVPNEMNRRSWCNAGVPPAKVRVAPLGVDGAYFSEPVRTPAPIVNGRPLNEYRHRFLNVAELRPRKNHLGLLRTWIRATTSRDDAVLLLKCSVFQKQNMALFSADLEEMQTRLGRSLNDAAPVVMIPDMLADEQMRALYQSASHYISLSFGEGWDLAMMEAACAGLHLIAPSHSAYCSYLSDRDADMIPACPVPAVPEGRAGAEDRVFFDGLTWWRPDEDAAVDVIQGIIGGSAAPKPSPQARIIREYSWENAGGHLLEILNGL